MMSEPLHEKYRPIEFNEVVGQRVVIKALSNVLKKGTSRAFVFAGPSGVGKTTLAKIAAATAGCDVQNTLEIDAATKSGVNDMRLVAEAILYKPFGEGEKKAVIVDEAHGLSKQAWDSLLKVVEKPPKHALWFFCTTDPRKLPITLKTRCTWLALTLVSEKLIRDLVEEVADAEKIKMDASVMDLVIREAHGSPRQALVNLATCDGIRDRKEAAQLLRTVLDTDATRELCRFLMKPGSWMKATMLIAKLEDESPEGVRIVVCRYMESVCKGAKSDKQACHALSILEAFATPYNQAEGMAPLFLSVGRVLYP